jgi:ribonuclease HI
MATGASTSTSTQNEKYTCYVDGGCLNNGRHNAVGYGSYKLYKKDKIVHEDLRFRVLLPGSTAVPMLKGMTNNVAEAMSINRVLLYLSRSNLLKNPKAQVTINSDSELSINQILGIYKIKDRKLLHVAKERHHILEKIRKYSGRNPWECIFFNKVPREHIVKELGH